MTTTNLGMTIPTVGADTDNWGNDLNTDLGLIDAFAGKLMPGAEVSLASAATTDIGNAASTAVAISGATTITSFGTVANCIRFVRFTAALTLTHNATSLILLGGASRTTAAGGVGVYRSDSSGNWRELAYHDQDVSSGASAKFGSVTVSGNASIAGTLSAGHSIVRPGYTVNATSSNNAIDVVSAFGGGLVFVTWNGSDGWALFTVASNGVLIVIGSSNSLGNNNCFDTTNNTASNDGNGVACFVSSGQLYFQLKTNTSAQTGKIAVFAAA
jgi:hypothetical protein